jgi:hypothetical protein
MQIIMLQNSSWIRSTGSGKARGMEQGAWSKGHGAWGKKQEDLDSVKLRGKLRVTPC